MRSRETKYRELIPESHYISIWKLVGMPFRICSLIYSIEVWMIKDSDITSLTQLGTLTNRVTLKCDRNGQYFSGSPEYTSSHFMWIWKILVWSGYSSETIYETWQTAKRHLLSFSSIFPASSSSLSVSMGGVMLLYNQVSLPKIDGPNGGYLTQSFS